MRFDWWPWLSEPERKCCHMSGAWSGLRAWWSGSRLGRWRQEFRSIARSERCRDCPILVPANVTAMFDHLVAREVTTQDPARAIAAVIQEDAHIRLVVDHLFEREGDITVYRGEPLWAATIKDWQMMRAGRAQHNGGDENVLRVLDAGRGFTPSGPRLF